MLEFKEVTYLCRLKNFPGRVEEIYTTEGSIYLDYDKCLCWPLITALGVSTTLWHFLKGGSTLYLMREEPIYYA